MIDNRYVYRALRRLGKLLEIAGESSFKTRAYSRGAEIIKTLERPVQELIESGEIGRISGIGPALKEKIIDIVETGTCNALERVENEIPDGIKEMTNIKGLGPQKIRTIWLELGITNLGELLYACKENRLAKAKGFGAKTQQSVCEKIEYYLQNQNAFHIHTLQGLAASLLSILQDVEPISASGETRRWMPTGEKIELISTVPNKEQIENLIAESSAFEVIESSDEKILIHFTDTQVPAEIALVDPADYVKELFIRTGHPDHIAKISIPGNPASEEEIYSSNELQFIPPEMREDQGEIEMAKQDAIPQLIEIEDIQGLIHCHSTWSDGSNTLEQLVQACRKTGLSYLGITDHSKSAFYANGLSDGRVEQQHVEIDQLNSKLEDFTIFKGIESDILMDGSLDYADEVLHSFDFVIGSIHSQFNMDEEKATKRLIKAIENPHLRILGHPTGRLLLIRPGYPIDHVKVIDACAANGVAIEINSNPYRLDIDWKWLFYAKERGVMICINPDAHSIEEILFLRWGTAMARKGGLAAADILNTWSASDVKTWFEKGKA